MQSTFTFCHTINKLHYCDKFYGNIHLSLFLADRTQIQTSFCASVMGSAIFGIKLESKVMRKRLKMELSWHLKGTVMNTRFYK